MLFGFPKTTEYEYEYYSATQKWPNTNNILLPNNDRIQISFGFPKMIEYYIQNFVELPKWKASKTSSESYKVMLNSASPLMTEAKTTNANSFQSIWLIRCDSGIWGWYADLAHKVVLAAPSTQRRTLIHLFFQRISWSGHQKSESAVTNLHVPIYEGLGPTHQKYQCWAKLL